MNSTSGSGSASAFPIRVRTQGSQINADPCGLNFLSGPAVSPNRNPLHLALLFSRVPSENEPHPMGWHPDGAPTTGVYYGAPFLSELERPAAAVAAKSCSAPTATAAAKTCPAPTPAEEEGVRFVNMGGPPDSYLDRLCGLAGFMAGQVIPLSWWLPGKAGPP
jgi:hypothetical protein